MNSIKINPQDMHMPKPTTAVPKRDTADTAFRDLLGGALNNATSSSGKTGTDTPVKGAETQKPKTGTDENSADGDSQAQAAQAAAIAPILVQPTAQTAQDGEQALHIRPLSINGLAAAPELLLEMEMAQDGETQLPISQLPGAGDIISAEIVPNAPQTPVAPPVVAPEIAQPDLSEDSAVIAPPVLPQQPNTTAPPISVDADLQKPRDSMVAPLDLHEDMGTEEALTEVIPSAKNSSIEVTAAEHRPVVEQPRTRARETDAHTEEAAYSSQIRQPEPNYRPEPVAEEPVVPQRAPDQTEQIRAQVLRNLEDNRLEFRMQLNPQELGKVDVRMALENGALSIEILAASPKAAELLSRQGEVLASTLRAHNLDIAAVTVVTPNQTASGQMSGAYNFTNHGGERDAEQGQAGQRGYRGERGEQTGTEKPDDSVPNEVLNYTI